MKIRERSEVLLFKTLKEKVTESVLEKKSQICMSREPQSMNDLNSITRNCFGLL